MIEVKTDSYGLAWLCRHCVQFIDRDKITHLRKDHKITDKSYKGFLARHYDKVKIEVSKNGTQYVLNHYGAYSCSLEDYIERLKRHRPS